jgi:multiple antibiotic resistance protein
MDPSNHLRLAAYFFVVLNPFSQALFLWDLMRSTERREFAAIYFRASLLSLGVYALFALTGEFLFIEVFQVRIEAFRIFGGLIVFIISVRYFTHGSGSAQFFQGKPSQIASSISIPFMVGPATIWISIVIGRSLPAPLDVLTIAAVLGVNFALVCLAQVLIARMRDSSDSLLASYFTILMRTSALFIGAIGIEMILAGLEGAGALPGGAAP